MGVTKEFAIAPPVNVRASLDSKARVADVSPALTAAVDMANVSIWLYPMLITLHGTRKKRLNASATPDTLALTVRCASAHREPIPLPPCTLTTTVSGKSSGHNNQAKNGASKRVLSCPTDRCTGRLATRMIMATSGPPAP